MLTESLIAEEEGTTIFCLVLSYESYTRKANHRNLESKLDKCSLEPWMNTAKCKWKNTRKKPGGLQSEACGVEHQTDSIPRWQS